MVNITRSGVAHSGDKTPVWSPCYASPMPLDPDTLLSIHDVDLVCYQVVFVLLTASLPDLVDQIEVWATNPSDARRAALASLNRHNDVVERVVGVIDMGQSR